MCMWVFNEARINFDLITAFHLVILGTVCNLGYGVCIINYSYMFQWIFLKPGVLVVNILKMCMLFLMELELLWIKLRPFELSLFRNTYLSYIYFCII